MFKYRQVVNTDERDRLRLIREENLERIAYARATMPQITMIVSPWFKDDDGLQTRIVRAA